MSQTVSLKIQINDGGTFKDVTINADDLASAINTVKDRADDLDKSLVSMASISQIAEAAASSIQNLYGFISNLTSAYKDAAEADTKLVTAMRNTMDASDEEIQAIRDFCDAQEQMGVVSADVQESAAQELATYLEYSDSLKTLIPVVNDMTVQQYGLNASAESATQIATMLGKVMNGQTKALSRYGYEFTEAQEAVLLYGDEAQRAAMLAEVVGQSVGGMNREMAKTPIGAMKQMENRMGKIHERIGAIAISLEPTVKRLSMLTSTAADIARVSQALQTLEKTALGAKAASLGLTAAQKLQATAAKILGVSEMQAQAATGALRAEIIATEAAISLGLSLAIAGLTTLLSNLFNKGKQAAASIEEVDSATEEFGRASGEARGEIMLEIGTLEDIIEKHKKEKDKVEELNNKYGESFGYHSTAAEWYDTLTTKSEAYCRQLGYEAKAKLLASQLAEASVAADRANQTVSDMEKSGNAYEMKRKLSVDSVPGSPLPAVSFPKVQVETEAFSTAKEAAAEAAANVQKIDLELKKCVEDARQAAEEMGPIGGGGNGSGGDDGKIKGIAADIQDYKLSVERAVEINRVFGGTQTDTSVKMEAMKSGITSLIAKYGVEDQRIKDLISDYVKLRSIGSELPKLDPSKLTAGAEALNVSGLVGDLQDLQNESKATVKEIDKVGAAQEALGALSNVFSNLSDVVGEGAAAWLDWGANVVSAIAQAIPSIIALTTAERGEATVNVAAMATGAGKAMASIPYVGPVLAIAAIASVLAAVANLPKFANGGIAYGPTLGLFGEYPGASNNPEVVAPLSKLSSLLPANVGGGEVVFRISGKDLYGVLDRRRSFVSRNR